MVRITYLLCVITSLKERQTDLLAGTRFTLHMRTNGYLGASRARFTKNSKCYLWATYDKWNVWQTYDKLMTNLRQRQRCL